jgi:DNA-binding transcriptional regulator YhcF (GntR family)
MPRFDDTWFQIIQCIVAHPESRPSLRELERQSTSLRNETIQDTVQQLVDTGVVERAGSTTVCLTDDGRDELEGTGIFDAEETLQHYYRST